MYSSKKRMAGDDEFQANLRSAQMQNEAQENSKTAVGGETRAAVEPQKPGDMMTGEQDLAPGKDTPQKDPQDFLKGSMKKYSRGSDLQEKGEGESDRSFEDGLDPELAKQAQQGGDFGPKDLARYRELYDKKYGSGGSSGGSGGGGTQMYDEVKTENKDKYGDYGSVGYKGQTFAGKAIEAAAKSNPVNFKALDQRIHDRPLYTQAKADIKHSETFGDTWSWDSAPKWNMDRFKSEPMKNRYEDVMDKDDDDD